MPTSRRTIARAEALFVSPVPTGTPLTPDRLDAEVVAAIGRHGGVRQCAAAMAAEFGDQPEMSVRRMNWALRLVTPAPAPAPFSPEPSPVVDTNIEPVLV